MQIENWSELISPSENIPKKWKKKKLQLIIVLFLVEVYEENKSFSSENFTIEPLLDDINEELLKKNLKAKFLLSDYESSINNLINKKSKFIVSNQI